MYAYTQLSNIPRLSIHTTIKHSQTNRQAEKNTLELIQLSFTLSTNIYIYTITIAHYVHTSRPTASLKGTNEEVRHVEFLFI